MNKKDLQIQYQEDMAKWNMIDWMEKVRQFTTQEEYANLVEEALGEEDTKYLAKEILKDEN